MKLEMRAHGLELTEKLRTHIERKLRFALKRFGPRVRRVHVLVADVNGPKGGYDIQCKIRAELDASGQLVLGEIHTDPFAAVARAAERVTYAVARRISRVSQRRRGRSRRQQ